MHEVQFCILNDFGKVFFLHETQKENCLPNRNWKKELSVDVADGGSNAIGGGTKRTSLVDVTWRWERERRVK
jgi:hypothetical protein